MSNPVRIQRSRQKGSRLMSPNGLPVVCVTRPGRWGNPFAPGEVGPMERKPIDGIGAVGFFEDMLRDSQMLAAAGYPSVAEIRHELRGKNLACWCMVGEPCHADVLLKVANDCADSQPPRPASVRIEGGHAIGLDDGRCIHCGQRTERIRSHGYTCEEFQRQKATR